jgi:hypothetical protein
MLTLEGKQRTLGGCFFALFKQEATSEQLHQFYQLRYEARAARYEHDGHDQSAPATAATTTKPVAPVKPEPAVNVSQRRENSGAGARLSRRNDKSSPAVKAGQAGQSGKRKPIAPAGNNRKSK